MPDNRSKRPLPAVMDVGTFQRRFGTDQACWEHLRDTRWGTSLERFVCPECGHGEGWWLANRRLVECRECHRQTSVTAGTVFHRARVPLWKWFWAIYQLAQDKKGIAALTLAKQIGVCYGTAWLMLLKLRRAMRRRNERYVRQGLVEVVGCILMHQWETGKRSIMPVGCSMEVESATHFRAAATLGALAAESPEVRKLQCRNKGRGASRCTLLG